jgi:hypothetical protein
MRKKISAEIKARVAIEVLVITLLEVKIKAVLKNLKKWYHLLR